MHRPGRNNFWLSRTPGHLDILGQLAGLGAQSAGMCRRACGMATQLLAEGTSTPLNGYSAGLYNVDTACTQWDVPTLFRKKSEQVPDVFNCI